VLRFVGVFDVASGDLNAYTIMRPLNVGEALCKINTASRLLNGYYRHRHATKCTTGTTSTIRSVHQ